MGAPIPALFVSVCDVLRMQRLPIIFTIQKKSVNFIGIKTLINYYNMNKWVRYWVPGISVVAILLSFCAIGYAHLRVESITLDIDRYSLMIDVLSILTTMLIGWQIFNYVSFEGKMKRFTERRVKEAKVEIEKNYIRGLVSTNLLLIPQYASAKNVFLVLAILNSLYVQLLKIEDYETADDVSMSVIGYFSFDIIEVDVNSVKQILPTLEKISPHSNQTDLLLSKLKDKCGLNNS